MVSDDGGATWARRVRARGDPHHWEHLSFSKDGKFGLAVSNEAGVFVSTDLGMSWERRQLPIADPVRIQAVYVSPSGQQAWLAAPQQVLRTNDRANTWDTQRGAFSAFHVDRDGKRVWAIGNNGVFHSNDGGRSWALQYGSPVALTDLTFNDDGMRGWAVGLNGRAIKTIDGGRTWNLVPTDTLMALSRVRFSQDGARGMAVGMAGVVLVSDDAGRSWRSATLPPLTQLVLAGSDDLSHAWVAREGGIYITGDGGRHWRFASSQHTKGVNAMAFHPDRQRGWAVAQNAIIATHDGGVTWSVQKAMPTPTFPASIAFLSDGLHGMAVAGELVFNTVDGGKTWANTPELEQLRIFRLLYSTDDRQGWALGDGVLRSFRRGTGWRSIAEGISFQDIAFDDNGVRGYAIDTSNLYFTSNGGVDWTPRSCSKQCDPRSVTSSGDGMSAWFGHADGTIDHTADGGSSWTRQDTGLAEPLVSVQFSRDGVHGLAIGSLGEIAHSDDGGKSWARAEGYSRAPAPWYWVAVLMAALPIWLAWHLRPSGVAQQSVADVGASDAAIHQASDDRLEFRGLARGISRFLRNPATGAPLTLAISGDWGSGKSSLMQLVCSDLRRFDHFPIWFNAWHHQKEEHLFAALLGAVRSQAVPPLLSLAGLGFRLRLLWLRSREHFIVMLLLLISATALIAHTAPQILALDFTRVTLSIEFVEKLWQPLVLLLGTFGVASAAVKSAVKPFHVNPALLLTSLRDKMSVKMATAQNDFRDQFARQFSELTSALPQRLVIVIDDLDRCRPAAVLDVMETVNYLTSAGECMVIFGMARERVLASLGLAFKDIAEELVLMDGAGVAGEGASDPAVARRRIYAADYLQKLINIEISVPPTWDRPLHELLIFPDSAPRRTLMGAAASAWKLWPVIVAVIAIVLGMNVSTWIPAGVADRSPPVPVVAKPSVGAPGGGSGAAPVAVSVPTVFPVPSTFDVTPGQRERPITILVWLVLACIPSFVTACLVLLRLLRKGVNETRDSERFRKALEIWTPLVAARRPTPRSIKRFGNRMRYLAMLQQGEQSDETRSELIKRRIAAFFRRQPPEPARATIDVLAEHQLIAIGAIHELHGVRWYGHLASSGPASDSEMREPAEAILHAAIDAHRRAFATGWPPNAQEIAVFRRLLSGVRLAGDPSVVGSGRPARPASGGNPSQQSQSKGGAA